MQLKLTTLIAISISILNLSLTIEASSIFSSIYGFDNLRDLTITGVNTISDTINGASDWFGGQLSETGKCIGCPSDPDDNRNVSEIIKSRGFECQEYDVITDDGYILTIQRIVNPLIKQDYKPKMKPVIMQHGLMSSSVDWVINSVNVKPEEFPNSNTQPSNDMMDSERKELIGDSQKHPNSLGFYLANRGYDVYLANSRGNLYGQKHVNLTTNNPKFWSFTFDEQIKYDLPNTIEFVQKLTGHKKLGYVGHSQGTVMIFGLLSDRPAYADIIEPVIALAPVAYVNNSISPVRYFAYLTAIFEHIDWKFATSNRIQQELSNIVCGPKVIRKDLCANIIFLSTGFDLDELDDSRVSAYLHHMPSGTSVKNIAHYGQEVLNGRFAHFDHGIFGNLAKYNQTKPPSYDLSQITSQSIVLFTAENDWLASPKDVARLKSELKVKPFRVYNMTEDVPKWNHIDFVYAKHTGELVNTRIHEVFEHFQKDL